MADDTTSKFKKMLSFFEGIRDEYCLTYRQGIHHAA